MKKANILLCLFFLCATYSVYGQISCLESDLIGEWEQVKYIFGVKQVDALIDLRNNVLRIDTDSLKKITKGVNEVFVVFEFKTDNIYTSTYRLSGEMKKYNKSYTFNQAKCEIYLRKKKRIIKSKYSESKLNIIYLDKQLLVVRRWHHKFGDVIELYHKKE